MDRNVLVYDSQSGYYELLKEIVTTGFNFRKYNVAEGRSEKPDDYNVLVFFLHEPLETLDFLKLYRDDIPVILANGHDKNSRRDNVSYIDLSQTKDQIVAAVRELFDSMRRRLQG